MEKENWQKKIDTYFPAGNFPQYIVVLVTGTVLILLTLFMPFEDRKLPVSPSSAAAAETAERIAESTEAAENAAGKSAETTVSKTAVREKEVKETILSQEIIGSTYQSVNGYTWEEMYSLLITIGQSSPMNENQVCGFNILSLEEDESPLFLIGKYEPEKNTVEMVLYVVEDGKMYELMPVEGIVYFSPSRKAYYVNQPDYAYIYAPHIIKKVQYEQYEKFPEDIVLLPITNAKEKVITNDNLNEYVTFLSEVTE